MTDTKELYSLINQLWQFIRDRNEMLSDNEDTWQRLMDDADALLAEVEDTSRRHLLRRWLVAYMEYADRREGRILHDGND